MKSYLLCNANHSAKQPCLPYSVQTCPLHAEVPQPDCPSTGSGTGFIRPPLSHPPFDKLRDRITFSEPLPVTEPVEVRHSSGTEAVRQTSPAH
ncbi:hypothetical protein PLANTIT3_60567 [Plantibacter sp. T3]|nr:hypothetical protein PLANTIT3_60567 [Plantibacter sp. T3]